MGGLISRYVRRPLRSFNIENRTDKAISKDKPTLAPKHDTALQKLEQLKAGTYLRSPNGGFLCNNYLVCCYKSTTHALQLLLLLLMICVYIVLIMHHYCD